ncbi:hypothetical protein [Empedobacter sedimenti]|uniref:hypothetical protein n=1 Tax=Empedobacter sedimenti TaxID=3042610 RepID=UPI0024A6E237|nr:hypothetical protein [Empedobacter sedimenti]
MQIILEILAWLVFEFFGVILGASVRFAVFKMFKPSLKYNEFLDSESGSNDFYNLIVGIPTFCGLIFGIFYLFN